MNGEDPSGGLLILIVAAVWTIPYAVRGVVWIRRHTRRATVTTPAAEVPSMAGHGLLWAHILLADGGSYNFTREPGGDWQPHPDNPDGRVTL